MAVSSKQGPVQSTSRIDDAVNQKLREEQAGFRAATGCIDQIFTLRTIIEQCTEWNTLSTSTSSTSKKLLIPSIGIACGKS